MLGSSQGKNKYWTILLFVDIDRTASYEKNIDSRIFILISSFYTNKLVTDQVP